MSDNAKEWRWVGEDGVEKTVTEQDLIAELSSEALPGYTLVWRRGWAEWLPAMQVAELSWTLPSGKADSPAKPRVREGAENPPAPPLYRYPVLKRRAQNMKNGKVELKPGRPIAREIEPPTEPLPPDLKLPRPPGAKPLPLPVPVPPTRRVTSAVPPPPGRTLTSRPPPAPSSRLPLPPVPPPAPSARPPAPSARPPSPSAAAEELEVDDVDDVEEDSDIVLESAPSAPRVEPDSFEEVRSSDVNAAPAPEELDAELAVSDPDHAAPEPPTNALPIAGMRAYDDDADDEATRVVGREGRAMTSGAMYVAPHTPPPSEAPPPSLPSDLPPIPPPPAAPADLSDYANRAQGSLLSRLAPLARVSQLPRRYLIAGGAALLLLVLVVAFSGGSEDDADGAEVAAGEEPAAGEAPASPGAAKAPAVEAKPAASTSPAAAACTVRTKPLRLSESAEPGVAPAFTRIPGSQRVAVGFAQSHTYAIGITIDPLSLDRDQIFRKYRDRKHIVSVSPLGAEGKLRFEVVHDDDTFQKAALIDTRPPVLLGKIEGGLARQGLSGGDPDVVFASVEGDTTPPRVIEVEGTGYAVAVRAGGTAGKVYVGWLDAAGKRLKDLAPISTKKEFAGTPSIAANAERLLVAFANRGASDGEWSLALASAPHAGAPGEAMLFSPPPGGPGKNLISPAVAGTREGWVLQWTEGKSGNRVVRLQVLDASLKPVSEPINLSPDDVNAGGGSLWVQDDTVTSLFYVQQGKGHELWGTTLQCSL